MSYAIALSITCSSPPQWPGEHGYYVVDYDPPKPPPNRAARRRAARLIRRRQAAAAKTRP